LPRPLHYPGLPARSLRATRRPGEILDWLREFAPDLVHVHYWDAPGDRAWYQAVLAAAGAWGAPVIQNVNVPCPPLVHPAVSQTVYVSGWARAAHDTGAVPSRVIHPGTDLGRFAPLPGDGDAVGMIYRLDRDKLSPRSIDPLLRLAKTRPGTRFIVAGSGPLSRTFQRQATRSGGRFLFPGTVPFLSLPELYAQMAVFTAPVFSESFGSTAVYAMAMGIPVAGYATGALPEVVGHTETLAPPGDAESLAKLLASLLDDPESRRRQGAKAAARARELFSLPVMLDAYRKLYGELLDGGFRYKEGG
ncbi:MAG: glycosyltransferase family 4 protein, partial [Pseudomonadota bacterium]